MHTQKLFAQIWRINAVIILLVGLIAGAVFSVVGYILFKEATRTRRVDNVANTVLGDVRESAAELGSFSAIPGSTVLRAPLTVRQTYALNSGFKEAGSTRNYLYFEASTRSAYWLRPSMDSVILTSVALPSTEYGEKKLNAVVYVHVTVDKDSNGDERLTESDAKQIAISAPNGKSYRVLVTKADRLNEATLLSPTRLLILYSVGTKLAAVELNPTDFSSPATEYEVPTALK
jgi:hypothetical protein